jgi:hypothetical protein
MKQWYSDTDRGSGSKNTGASANLSTTNSTWADPGAVRSRRLMLEPRHGLAVNHTELLVFPLYERPSLTFTQNDRHNSRPVCSVLYGVGTGEVGNAWANNLRDWRASKLTNKQTADNVSKLLLFLNIVLYCKFLFYFFWIYSACFKSLETLKT